MTNLLLTDETLRQAQQEVERTTGRIAIYSLRIEADNTDRPALISQTGSFNLADVIIDAGSNDEFGENFESNWDYRHRAERIAANWITKHGAKSVKLYQIGRGQPKKLVHTYTRTLEEGAA